MNRIRKKLRIDGQESEMTAYSWTRFGYHCTLMDRIRRRLHVDGRHNRGARSQSSFNQLKPSGARGNVQGALKKQPSGRSKDGARSADGRSRYRLITKPWILNLPGFGISTLISHEVFLRSVLQESTPPQIRQLVLDYYLHQE